MVRPRVTSSFARSHASSIVFAICLASLAGLPGGVKAAPFASVHRWPAEISSLVVKANVTCRVYTEGNQRITEYCRDGYVCAADNKCLPGPEMRRQMEAEKARRLKELEQRQKELEKAEKEMRKFSQQAGKEVRRLGDGQRLGCNPSTQEIAGCIHVPPAPRGPTYYAGGGGGGGTRCTLALGVKNGCADGGGSRPARNPSTPQRNLSPVERVQYGNMIQNLLGLRDSYDPGSDDWNNANDNLKTVDRNLLDRGVDLPQSFTDVYRPLPDASGQSAPVNLSSANPSWVAPTDGIIPLENQHYWKGTSNEADCAAAGELERTSSDWKSKCGNYRIDCPAAPEKNWKGTPNEFYCRNANCVERGSAPYGLYCYPPDSASNDDSDQGQQAGGSGRGPKTTTMQPRKAPKHFTPMPKSAADRIQDFADSILALPDNDPNKIPNLQKLRRMLADNAVPVSPKLEACLQAMKGTDAKLIDIPLRWHPYHIKKEAIDQSGLCDGVAEGEAKDACREAKYGQAVMWAEPEIAGQCRGMGPGSKDIDAVAECAKNKFLNSWANNGILAAPKPANWETPSECSPQAPRQSRTKSLRDALRERLAARDQNDAPAAEPPPPPEPPPPEARNEKPMFGETHDDDCTVMAGDYLDGHLALKDIPARCQPALQKMITTAMGPDAEEIEKIKQYLEQGTLPPGAVGDAFGRPVEQTSDLIKPQ